jgi:hypothetical protein
MKAPPTAANYQFINQWATREHSGGPALSDGSNNPFFTTAGAGGTVGPIHAGTYPAWNSIGVARYPTLEVGVIANAYHIATEYPAILAAFRSGNPAASSGNAQFQSELTRWSGGGYAGFASIPATAGPVGPTVDPTTLQTDATKILAGGTVAGGGSSGGGIGGANSGAAGAITGAVGGAAGHIPGVAQAEAVGGFIGKLSDPSYILRGLQIVAGGVLVLVGVVLLAKQVALAADLPTPPVPGLAGAGAAPPVE